MMALVAVVAAILLCDSSGSDVSVVLRIGSSGRDPFNMWIGSLLSPCGGSSEFVATYIVIQGPFFHCFHLQSFRSHSASPNFDFHRLRVISELYWCPFNRCHQQSLSSFLTFLNCDHWHDLLSFKSLLVQFVSPQKPNPINEHFSDYLAMAPGSDPSIWQIWAQPLAASHGAGKCRGERPKGTSLSRRSKVNGQKRPKVRWNMGPCQHRTWASALEKLEDWT